LPLPCYPVDWVYYLPSIISYHLGTFIKKAELLTCCFKFMASITFYYFFLNFLLNPAKQIKPEPRRSKVVGSGRGAVIVSKITSLAHFIVQAMVN